MRLPRLGLFILDGHTPIEVDDMRLWAEWFEKADRRVGWDDLGPYIVSTVFLGLDHNFMRFMDPTLPPDIFETMVFTQERNAEGFREEVSCERWSTWEEAEAGHQAHVAEYRYRVLAGKGQ